MGSTELSTQNIGQPLPPSPLGAANAAIVLSPPQFLFHRHHNLSVNNAAIFAEKHNGNWLEQNHQVQVSRSRRTRRTTIAFISSQFKSYTISKIYFSFGFVCTVSFFTPFHPTPTPRHPPPPLHLCVYSGVASSATPNPWGFYK